MFLKYIGGPGCFVDIETRTKWAPGEEKEVVNSTHSSRLLGSGLFQIVQKQTDELPTENKMDAIKRRK